MTDTIEVTNEKSEDKRDIEMEEREKMLNAENRAQGVTGEEAGKEAGKETTNDERKKEGMEVKPKKIPIGGIQMPGFFTRSKSKEKCKEDEQEEQGTELIETKTDPQPTQSRIKLPTLPNPFRKSKLVPESDETGEKSSSDPKETNKFLTAIRLPLSAVWPRKKTADLADQQAGLASMETLEDKSTEDAKLSTNEAELKNVPLDSNEKKSSDEDKKKDLEMQAVELVQSWREFFRNYRVACSVVLLLILVTVIIIIASIPQKEIIRIAPIKDGKYVEAVTSCGLVEGLVEDSAVAFRGIPYARPPLADLRFRAAQPLDDLAYCWNGTLLAHNSSRTCLQIHANGSLAGTEDCLTLDVVTPYVRYDNPLPVVVLVGAESLVGGSPGKMRPSARYARSKDVVFVRPNFRLGALGFLALEQLTRAAYPHTSGNYGLSDLVQALRWVQLNIEHFGGDRRAVTVFGHRAGATLVTALAGMRGAERYFARAWAASGGAVYPTRSRAEAEIGFGSFLRQVDCADAACLRALPAEKVTGAVEDTWRKAQPDLPGSNGQAANGHQWLVLDGQYLKENPLEALQLEDKPQVKLVLGTTAHCGASPKLQLKHKTWTDGLVRQHINASFISGLNLTKEVYARYNLTYKGLSSLVSDVRTVCPLLHLRETVRNVGAFYVVTQTRIETDLADVDSDVDAILGRYEPKTPEQKRYFSAMQGLFYHFVWFGKVEVKEEPGNKVLLVGQDVLSNATYGNCDFWVAKNVVPQFAALD